MIVAGEVTFSARGKDWTLQYVWDAIDWFERRSGVSFVEAVTAIEQAPQQGKMPMLSHSVYLLQAGLQEHHGLIDHDQAMQILAVNSAWPAVWDALRTALPDVDEQEGDDAGNGQSATGASTGTKP